MVTDTVPDLRLDLKVPFDPVNASGTSEIGATGSELSRSTLDYIDRVVAEKYPEPDLAKKRCPACGQTKPVDDFYRNSGGMPGHRCYCKPCHKAKRRESYLAKGGKDVPYEQVLRRDYGITLAEYNAKLRAQAHRCAVCRRPETVRSKSGEPRRLSVDHDHVTGTVRGLLCHRCNILVWAFEDNHTTLSAISAYVEEFRASFAAGS